MPPVADETKAQGCAETGAMQTAVKQSDIVSNGKGKSKSPDAFRHFGAQNGIFLVPEQVIFGLVMIQLMGDK